MPPNTATTPTPMKLSKEFLLEIGGWRALQEGRALLESDKVLQAEMEPPLIKGVVQAGTTTVNARLKIGTRLADVENLCSCRQAREYGTICPHVVAIGLKLLQKQEGESSLPSANGKFSEIQTRTAETEESIPKEEKKNRAKNRIKRIPADSAEKNEKLLQLSVLLPMDFTQAWKSEKMRIILEGSVDGETPVPLDAVPRGDVYSMYEADRRVLRATEKICGGEAPGMWMLTEDAYTDFFESLMGHGRVMLGKKAEVKVLPAPAPSELGIDVYDDGDLHIHLHQKNDLPGKYLYTSGSAWRWDEKKHQLELLRKLSPAYRLLRSGDVVLPRSAVGHFVQNELPQLERHITVELSPNAEKLKFTESAPKIRLEIDGLLSGLSCRIQAVYGSVTHDLSEHRLKTEHSHNAWMPDPEDPFTYFVRDRKAELAALREAALAGFVPGQRNADLYALTSENKVGYFLANVLPRWKERWEVSYSPRMETFLEKCDFIRPEISIQSSGEEWLTLNVEFRESKGKTELSQQEVQQLLQKGVSHHRMANGRIAFLPTDSVLQFSEVLFDCQVEASENGWRLNKLYGNYLYGVLKNEEWKFSSRSNWKPAEDIKSFEEIKFAKQLETTLRSYQKTGVSWLHYLAQNQFGGILADEMGLGKTIQTLAYLDYRKKHGLSKKPSLIVGPTSLVQNWAAEAGRFTPELSILPLQGIGRKALFAEIPKHDLIITSYALMRRDIEELKNIEFDTIVLDEAQNIKNRSSQNAQCAKTLQAANRFVLTGTPMENSLLDLWSILDFLLPGYLGPASEFRDRYENPIVRSQDDKALARLQERIRPFMLRRTKKEVARDLPPRLEQTAYCELSDEQKAVYQRVLEQGRREVFEHSSQKPSGRDRLAVLTTLMRLRQICCHLKLLPENGKKHSWESPSAKMEYFFELLGEAIDGGHRVLVFSQFVSLLKLIETEVKKNKIPYCYLDGSTKDRDRQSEIERFQTSDVPVFLISLKAGGTGLNLTGADTVVHFDPWWNPAVEDQAASRAHRIGQTKIVTSYKLIARGTVEEKIVKLQERKKDLIASTVVSEDTFIHSLTWEELQGLLE